LKYALFRVQVWLACPVPSARTNLTTNSPFVPPWLVYLEPGRELTFRDKLSWFILDLVGNSEFKKS